MLQMKREVEHFPEIIKDIAYLYEIYFTKVSLVCGEILNNKELSTL